MMSERNRLYYGDNLKVLREHIPDESVDLIYLDPPFNSARSYNVLFRDESGRAADAQITAFEDTWHWGHEAEATFNELVTDGPERVSTLMGALIRIVGRNQMMAYLVMMTARLVELHRVLKPTGSLYLHCDPTASHYLKLVLDTIFGGENFRNEIIWQRINAKGNASKRFANNHDVIFFYTRSEQYTWNPQYTAHDETYVKSFYKYVEPETGRRYTLADLTNPNKNRPNLTYEFLGVTRVWRWTKERMQKAYEDGLVVQTSPGAIPRLKRYLDEQEGTPLGNVWTDIVPLQAQSRETLGYPTQKPVALLERIIAASSNPGDVVLDPFCGCGTAIDAAHSLGRRWIGIDITHLSIALQKYRLKDRHGLEWKRDYDVIGEPEDEASARQLAKEDRYQFQWWALSLLKAKPLGGSGGRQGKKGADRGIDGVIDFIDNPKEHPRRILIQVKSGSVNSAMIRDLAGTLEREKAQMAVFVTLDPPSKPMITEAVSAGYYRGAGLFSEKQFPRIQIVTIGDLLRGKMPDLPVTNVSLRRAAAASVKGDEKQLQMFGQEREADDQD
ncbi:MAG: DNA methyltransferase [Candidatus Flexifilum sp.]